MRLFILALSLLATACATPVSQTQTAMTTADKDTSYAVDERPDGFTLTVQYGRYQFIPESSAVATACKQALTATAFDVADKRGRKIQPVNEQRIRLSMGRNGLTGFTTCEASVPVFWAP
jgi:hypothetical protein